MIVVGLQTDDAAHVGQNSSAHVARVVVTETRFTFLLCFNHAFMSDGK